MPGLFFSPPPWQGHPMNTPATRFIAHTAAHMDAVFRVASEVGRMLHLISAEGAGAQMGAGVFLAMAEAAQTRYPDAKVLITLDCADDTAMALNALRHGAPLVRIHGLAEEALVRLQSLAAETGATLETAANIAPPTVDLLDAPDPFTRVMTEIEAQIEA